MLRFIIISFFHRISRRQDKKYAVELPTQILAYNFAPCSAPLTHIMDSENSSRRTVTTLQRLKDERNYDVRDIFE